LRSSNKNPFSALITVGNATRGSGPARTGPEDDAISTCWQHYHTPGTVDEAIELLNRYDGRAQVIGGGTDLLLEIQQGRKPAVAAMVDPSRIAGLGDISEDAGQIVIGCAVTHSQIIGDERIVRHGTSLVEACGVIGGPQVRNVATLAGNIAHALPAGDGTIGLLVLDGEIETADDDGRRWMPLGDAFLGPGRSAVDHHRALLTRLRFKPTGKFEGSAFFRIMRPQGVALPMISMAACLRFNEDHSIEAARVAIAPAGPVPCLAAPAMEMLAGREASDELFARATEAALSGISLRSSKYRASREYRAEMVRTHLPRVLALATERAMTGRAVPLGVGQ
jgi:carbon-monoxide dehydrogenase medium subunit